MESAVVTAGSSAAAAGVKGAGKSIGGVFQKLSETLDKSGSIEKAGSVEKPGSRPAVVAETSVSSQPKQPAKPVPGTKSVNPSEITEGLGRAELIERFGEPLLSLTQTTNSQIVERMWYRTTTSEKIEIKLIGGMVAATPPPAEPL